MRYSVFRETCLTPEWGASVEDHLNKHLGTARRREKKIRHFETVCLCTLGGGRKEGRKKKTKSFGGQAQLQGNTF
jgi:hypothetical protein